MRAQTITPREMTTGQRQIRVGQLATTHKPEAIAEQLGVPVELVRKDLTEMEFEGYEPVRGRPPTGPDGCGTDSGWWAHKYRKQEPCEPCAHAHRQNRQAYAIRTGRRKRLTVSVIALAALYLDAPGDQQQRLIGDLGAEVCDVLADYHAEITKATRPRRRPGTAECGTEPGYQAHKHRKEKPCADCSRAHSRDQQARSIRKYGKDRSGRITVDVDALADLYVHAPDEPQQRLAEELGAEVCEALASRHANGATR
ncbi:hypothetical protein [Gordonia sp. UCD-TK1]|uniref:hypothetical protein n=1 Tax=Gordonia sp. UCD-TK1 TaxID=1857893 RepID=UPI00080DBFC4|nr:hypothetical protein [Gordonia sp. UCD-TK1]OCH80980.1 hypothetical protein A9310_19645 [Gordonia sp. UCD-TK1]